MIIIGCIIAIAVILTTQSLTKPTQTNEDQQHITKENITTNTNSSELQENYTSVQLLNYCTSNENQIYNDVCIRGLWDVSDQCKNENFSSTNSICNDSRFTEFENKVNNEMQDLDKSLTSFVNSCINVKSNNDTASCTINIERIQSDCTDPRFYEMMSVCKDPNFNMISKKYNQSSN
ncbi:exported protein of unknown function [Nitrosotalea devaniterrae]|uniref:Uncharacterized protein n=1 Tax=Nitrosotalea devaniterrae TaxID=1078905 RepID=A0A128A0H4_9ARCH|nr:exported protein of unknown function [Candidatus Nitrosotalea devanaterra]